MDRCWLVIENIRFARKEAMTVADQERDNSRWSRQCHADFSFFRMILDADGCILSGIWSCECIRGYKLENYSHNRGYILANSIIGKAKMA